MPSLRAFRWSNPACWISMDCFGLHPRNDEAPNLS